MLSMNLKKYLPKFSEIKDISFEYKFTVFVPVYNAALTVQRAFNSLNAQTFRDFEVIIINDGSTDNSHEIISQLLLNSTFEAVYINNTINKHKLGCILEAVEIARGEFFLILDADDECLPQALETFYTEYLNIPSDVKDKISGVTCSCVDQNGNLVGDSFPEHPLYTNSFDKKVYYNIKGEKWGFNKTNILKSINIDPEVFGKGLIPESYLWFFIAKQGFTTKYINKTLRIYYIETGGNSLSSLGYEQKAFGMAMFSLAFINWFQAKHFKKAMRHFFMRLYSLLKASKYLDFRLKEYVAAIDNYVLKAMFAGLWPFRALL